MSGGISASPLSRDDVSGELGAGAGGEEAAAEEDRLLLKLQTALRGSALPAWSEPAVEKLREVWVAAGLLPRESFPARPRKPEVCS